MSYPIVRSSAKVRGDQKRPRGWKRFEAQYPAVASAYDEFSDVCRCAGPLDDRAIALVKLAVSVGGTIDRTVHVHTKKALRTGVSAEALRQVALVAMPTIGLPRAMDALRWIEESIDEVVGATAGAHESGEGA